MTCPAQRSAELTRVYAKRAGLVFESTQNLLVGGVSRSMAIFRGTYQGVAVRHAVVALIGPSYRVAVAFQAPTQLVKTDPTITSVDRGVRAAHLAAVIGAWALAYEPACD